MDGTQASKTYAAATVEKSVAVGKEWDSAVEIRFGGDGPAAPPDCCRNGKPTLAKGTIPIRGRTCVYARADWKAIGVPLVLPRR
jgi:hypothetical protein